MDFPLSLIYSLGLYMSVLRLDTPTGYTCRINRSPTMEIPAEINQFGRKVLPAVALIWKTKVC